MSDDNTNKYEFPSVTVTPVPIHSKTGLMTSDEFDRLMKKQKQPSPALCIIFFIVLIGLMAALLLLGGGFNIQEIGETFVSNDIFNIVKTGNTAGEDEAQHDAQVKAGDIVYDATDDFLGFIDPGNLPGSLYPGHEGLIHPNGSGSIVLAGEPHVISVAGKRGIEISNRINDWDAVDFLLGGLKDGHYTIKVTCTAEKSLDFWLQFEAANWEDSGRVPNDARERGESVTLTTSFSIRGGQYRQNNRIRINATAHEDYRVERIQVIKN